MIKSQDVDAARLSSIPERCPLSNLYRTSRIKIMSRSGVSFLPYSIVSAHGQRYRFSPFRFPNLTIYTKYIKKEKQSIA